MPLCILQRGLLRPGFTVGLLLMGVSANGEITRDAAARLAVDVVLAKGGRELRGAILSRDDETLTMAVRRAWLKQHEPSAYTLLAQQEHQQREAARAETVLRIDAWLNEAGDAPDLVQFLKEERARLSHPPEANEPESEFAVLNIPNDDLRRVYAQEPERRQLAAVAWEQRLDDVERAMVLDLKEEVEKHVPDWQSRAVDLSDRLPDGLMQTDAEWRARRAIVEQRLVQDPLEFQGTGDFIIPTSGKKPDLENVISTLLGQQQIFSGSVAGAVQTSWKATAVEAAKKDGRRSVRVTRMDHDLQRQTITVETVLLAPGVDGEWQVVWRASKTGSIVDVRAEAKERILADPQVKEVIQAAQSLGLGNVLDQAIDGGAVTFDLQQTVNDQWFITSDKYLDRLDGPPLVVAH